MFDIGMTELLLIGIVALIVVGPKDLPGLFRTLGRFTAKARSLGREFSRAMNDAADQSGVKDVADGLKAASNPRKFGMDKLSDAAESFEKWDPNKRSGTAESDAPKVMDPDRAEDLRKIKEASQKTGEARLEKERAAAGSEASKAEGKAVKGKPPERPKPKPKAEEPSDSAEKTAATETKAKTSSKAPAKAKAPAKTKTQAKTAKSAAAKSTSTKSAEPKKSEPKKPAAKAKTAAKTPAKSTAKSTAESTAKSTAKSTAESTAKSTAKKSAPTKSKAAAKKATPE